MNKSDIAFTQRYGEHLTFPLLYVIRRPPSSCTGTDRCGSWLSRADWHWWHLGSRSETPAALSPCSLPYWLFQLYFLLLLGNHQLWVQPPFPQQLTSELPHCPPLSGCPCPAETQHPVNEMMKSYFLFLTTEEKWIISSSWFPFTIQHHGRAKWVYLYPSITWWTMKNLHSHKLG